VDDRDLKRLLANARGSAAGPAVLSLDDLGLRHAIVDPEAEPRFTLAHLSGRLVDL
jgi:hypothetical protein